MEPGPQHLCGHSRAHTSAQILGHLGDWGMSLILSLWLMVALIGGWGPQQRLGHTCSQLEKQTRGHPATSSISWKRFLVQHGLGHDGRHVWGEQASATHETGFGFFDVGVAVGRAKEWQRFKTILIPVLIKNFTTIGRNVVIWLANLPFSIRVQTSCRFDVSRNGHAPKELSYMTSLLCLKKQIKHIDSGLACSVLLSKTIFVITKVKIYCGLTQLLLVTPQYFVWLDDMTLMTNVFVNKSTDHAKPLSSCSLALPSRTLRFKTKN